MWTDAHRDQFAHDLAACATEEGKPAYGAYGLNLLLSEADHSAANSVALGEGVIQSGGVFDSTFLQVIATDIQTDEQQSDGFPHWRSNASLLIPQSPSTSIGDWDPMTGVLTAIGRNPEAALEYIAPPASDFDESSSSEPTSSTFDWLMNRDWDKTSMEGLTSALAGVSDYRVPDSSSNDERAAWVTEQATLNLAGSDDHPLNPAWSDTSRQNVSIMLGNSMNDIDAAAKGETNTTNATRFQTSQAAPWNDVHTNDVRALLQEVGKDDLALATLGTAAGQYSTDRVADVTYADDATPGQVANMTLQNDYLAGFIVGAATVGRDKEDADRDAGINFFFSALSDGLKFVPTLPSKTAGTALSIAQSRLLSSLNETMTSGSPGSTVADTGLAWQVYNHANAINMMADADMIPPEAYTNFYGEPYTYEWLNADGTIDIKMFTPAADGSNFDDIFRRNRELKSFSLTDPEFNAWGDYRHDFESAYEQGTKKGRGEA